MPRTIAITDRQDRRTARDVLRAGAWVVLSRSGLHASECALIEAAAAWPATASLLVAGNRTGVLPLVRAQEAPGTVIALHAFDIHHAAAAARNLAANALPCVASQATPVSWQARHPPVTLSCTADLPTGSHDIACLQLARGDLPLELVYDTLEQLHERLVIGGLCCVALDGPTAWLQERLKALFGPVSARAFPGASLLSARKQGPLRRRRPYAATFAASLPGDAPLQMTSLPGVFCHRRPDQGGLALAEVAATRLQPGMRLLDIGCGCGMVGLALARHAAPRHLLLVDSAARAVSCAAANALANGLTGCETLLSDSGVPSGEGFDLCVANPPYYSNYRIAELFLGIARSALRPGGRACFVARNTERLEALMRETFGRAPEVVSRRGYRVAVAEA